jgi:hypothetical protein
MVYEHGTATTLPVNRLDQRCIVSEVLKRRQYSHRLSESRTPFFETVGEGLQGGDAGWLLVPRTVIKAFLPELLEVGAIVVVDDKGGVDLTPDGPCVNLAAPEQSPIITPNPANAATVNAMVSKPRNIPGYGG